MENKNYTAKEVVINNIERTKFYGYCDNYGKRCMHWEIEFPKRELEKLEPVVHAGRKVKFENEDGSTKEWNCPPITYVKNHRFSYNGINCDIFSAIGFRTNEIGEEVCYTTAFFPIAYRKYKEGDTVRVTGEHEKLFSSCSNLELENGVKLGVECVLVRGEDADGEVRLPSGILNDNRVYISAKCVELVQAVEDKTATISHINAGSNSQLYIIDDSMSKYSIARIWYDPDKLSGEVIKAFAESIKAIYDNKPLIKKNKIVTYNNITENKTFKDEFESKFRDFECQFAAMYDPHPDEIRDFITTIILASAHDSSLVDAAFKWVENKNNNK